MMAYRDKAAAILVEADGMLRLCETAGKPYRIGVETQPPAPAIPTHTTFGDDGEAVMLSELTAAAERIALSLFDGFAVHHLDSWRTMPP